MTNEELIATIRNKVEGQFSVFLNLLNASQEYGYHKALEFVLSILSDIEKSEKPVPADLEEAAKKFAVFYDQGTCDGIAQDCFIAGAKWQKEQDDKELSDLLTIAHLQGAEQMKEQMLKEAVEGEVCGRVYDHINVRFADGVCKYLEPKNISHIPADVSKYKVGDKVRIIIVKE